MDLIQPSKLIFRITTLNILQRLRKFHTTRSRLIISLSIQENISRRLHSNRTNRNHSSSSSHRKNLCKTLQLLIRNLHPLASATISHHRSKSPRLTALISTFHPQLLAISTQLSLVTLLSAFSLSGTTITTPSSSPTPTLFTPINPLVENSSISLLVLLSK
jgi:hypothetical protein